MRRSLFLLFFSLVFCSGLFAQQIDAEFGLSNLHSSSATNFTDTSGNHSPQSLSGGVYPGFAADFIIYRGLGFNGEINWRASQGSYQNSVNFRPILYDFNGVYARKFSRIGFAGMAGIGAESIRFYENFVNCNGFGQCTNYVSSNHFLGHVGGEVRFYVTHSFFVAPEAHYYFVRNNVEFTSNNVSRYGVNIGYTFGR